jgi:hypothetical protein
MCSFCPTTKDCANPGEFDLHNPFYNAVFVVLIPWILCDQQSDIGIYFMLRNR